MTAIHLGRLSPDASSNQPGWSSRNTLRSCLSTARRPPLFDLAPGGVCPANPVARLAVGSYPTFSPLPPALCSKKGGIVSVALSLGSPPPDVIRHRFSVEPGLSSDVLRTAAVRPTGWLRIGEGRRGVNKRVSGTPPPNAAISRYGLSPCCNRPGWRRSFGSLRSRSGSA